MLIVSSEALARTEGQKVILLLSLMPPRSVLDGASFDFASLVRKAFPEPGDQIGRFRRVVVNFCGPAEIADSLPGVPLRGRQMHRPLAVATIVHRSENMDREVIELVSRWRPMRRPGA